MATALSERVREIERKSGATAIAVAVRDYETDARFEHNAERWFHAASTIKLAILLGVYGAIHCHTVVPQSRLHVRNRFLSAFDGEPFRVFADRDSNSEVHAAVGKTMRIGELARHMIATSSNLATNLLLDFIGLAAMQNTLAQLGLEEGIDLRRGVEDQCAFDHRINNRVTAGGLARLLALVAEERAFSPELSREMLDILFAQQFNSGIPARLPKGTRVAHKTGEISTVAHDAGIVYVPDRRPYVLVVLTEWEPDRSGRSETIASISAAVWEELRGDSKRVG